MADAPDRRPIDQWMDLFVYAPVGLVYEYQEVLPKLIKRGKSQVQIAKLLGTMAAKQGQRVVNSRLEDVIDGATSGVAQGITDIGSRVGLAPESPTTRSDSDRALESAGDDPPLPIVGYNDLTAKQIIGLLGDLDPAQRARIGAYEAAHRGRKTVMAKLDALAKRR
jgi:hypothetical protein